MSECAIVWFRRNLRLADNQALINACRTDSAIVPIFIHEPGRRGAASEWWLHHSLDALNSELGKHGNRLRIYRGQPTDLIPRIADACGAASVHYACSYEPLERADEDGVCAALHEGVSSEAVHDFYLYAPGTLLTLSAAPFKVFTPFYKASLNEPEPRRPVAPPRSVPTLPESVANRLDTELPTQTLPQLALLPVKPDWAAGLRAAWVPGERRAMHALEHFIESLAGYPTDRDRPDVDATSRLSPHLHFGEISARQVWHAVNDAAQAQPGKSQAAGKFLRQLVWRDFSGHLLYHFPTLPTEPLREEFRHFPWRDDHAILAAWQRGETGVPIVDAGMRQLWTTGWMHNRVRMVVASYLVKNLMVPWQRGAAWFFDTLVDADLANNSASWQWVAGCGTDAAPYFRIFNPVLQARKFDPDGAYIRRWVPELAELPTESLFEPWRADGLTRGLANVDIGVDYPEPLVDLGASRREALDAYQQVRSLLQSPTASPGSSAG